ncbi:hypothetical protein ABBQ32_006470 [Trebouxia sp. C0010 RCD-2024]
MVGSVSDPVITELLTTVNDSAFWADSKQDGTAETQLPNATFSHESTTGMQLKKGAAADRSHPSDSISSAGGFEFAGLKKPPSLTQQIH